MSEDRSSYRQILKSTSLFGGVQFISILVGIVRSKVIAILLGPSGMGVYGLFLSTSDFITALTGFGLSTSGVKEIAASDQSGNKLQLSIISTVLKKLAWFTGLLGLLLMMFSSSLLSKFAFGSTDFTFSFMLISVTLLFNQINISHIVLLRGTRQLSSMAKASMYASIGGLVTTLPFYFIWGIEGVVPGIIFSSLLSLLISKYFSKSIVLDVVNVSIPKVFYEGKEMLRMGFLVSMGGLLAIGSSYFLRLFISKEGSLEDVGLYNAGFAITNSYVGMIFTAMSSDYYPRLSSVANDIKKSNQLINHQLEIALLIISPVIIMFLFCIQWIIILLFSSKFIAVSEMIQYASIGIFFKAFSWAIVILFLARSSKLLYFWSEIAANCYFLVFNMLGYYLYGLTGLGLSFLVGYFIYFVQTFFIATKKLKFRFSYSFYRIAIIQIGLAATCLFFVIIVDSQMSLAVNIFILVASILFSLTELNKRIDLLSFVSKFIRR